MKKHTHPSLYTCLSSYFIRMDQAGTFIMVSAGLRPTSKFTYGQSYPHESGDGIPWIYTASLRNVK
ncbi:hypothetical protein ACTL6P_00720 [Endozoicomonas acroporae]|uniref:hypothetical protein n=1 Tax=Endozoicomonas acroporae TaxID=1701104 RepID=UPI000C786671|nr:hypothetical protein [Endozoicomonas acroporae]